MRSIEFEGKQLYVCPNGCDEAELELAQYYQSFMAIAGIPYKYIRCGECGFGDTEDEQVKMVIVDVIEVWNEKCLNASVTNNSASTEDKG